MIDAPAELRAAKVSLSPSDTVVRQQSVYSLRPLPELDFGGQAWIMDVQVPEMDYEGSAKIRAWAQRLREAGETTRICVPARFRRLGSSTVSFATAHTAAVAGLGSMRLSGLDGSLLEGSFISVSDLLYKVIVQSQPDGAIGIYPRLRADVPQGAFVQIAAPSGTWILASAAPPDELDSRYRKSPAFSLRFLHI